MCRKLKVTNHTKYPTRHGFFFSYDPREDKWNVLADMPTARALAGCTIFKNKIYVIGKNGYIADTIILEMHIEKNKQQ